MKKQVKGILLPLFVTAAAFAISPVAAASNLWEDGKARIFADKSRYGHLYPQLQKHAEKLARENAACPKIVWVDHSVNRNGHFYLLCSNNNKLYWTEADMKKGKVAKVPKHLSDDYALASCKRLVKSAIAPAPVKWHVFGTAINKVPQGRTRVTVEFSTKLLGREIENRAVCLVGHDVAEVQSIKETF
ncbi:MAG: hypothetical protein ACR2P4_04925 [Gammaproteobacteria bacterium]